MISTFSFGALGRGRFMFLLGLALILAGERSSNPLTMALFTAVATNPNNLISTVTLNLTTSASGSSFFSVSNMVPGDFSVAPITITNSGTDPNQSFTYTVTTAVSGTSTALDANAPNATGTGGAALLIFRCTSDAAKTLPVACNTTNVYVTQVYPTTGAGTQVKVTATGGLTSSSAAFVPPAVNTGAGNYTITIQGQAFTGDKITTPAYPMGGPDPVTGADSFAQTLGILGASPTHSDQVAALVYLPSQTGNTLAGLSSTINFTWTATQRAGKGR